jgi:hypothetical protein
MQKWIVRTNPTKYPDLFTYDVLEVNPDYVMGKPNSPKYFGVACGLDSKENAYKISASCEMYEALKLLLTEVRITDDTFGYGVFIRNKDLEVYKKAILKADGK